MPQLRSTGQSEKAFAFSLDATIAVIILVSVLAVIGANATEKNLSAESWQRQATADTFNVLEKSGFLLEEIDANGAALAAQNIQQRALLLLPENLDLNVWIKVYDANIGRCRQNQQFSECFSGTPSAAASVGSAQPSGKNIISGKKIFLRKQPPSDCELNYAGFAKKNEKPWNAITSPEAIFFDEDIGARVDFNVFVSTEDAIECGMDVTVTLMASVPDNIRNPVDIMLILDRSGSMGWPLTSLDTSGTGNAVFVDNNYAYLADGSGGLRIIDVNEPLQPALAGTYNTSGTAYGVFVQGNYAYVADGRAGLRIVDISSKSAPTLVGTYNSSGTAMDVFVSGNLAYLADYDRGLIIVNVTNKSSPASVGSYNTGGYSYGVFVDNNYAYVADGSAGLRIFDVNTQASPQARGTYNSSGSARGVRVIGDTAYLADYDGGLRIIDVTNKSSLSSIGSYNTSGRTYGVFVENQYAYIADGSAGARKIDISNPSNPQLVKTVDTENSHNGVFIDRNYAFMAAGSSGLEIIDANTFYNRLNYAQVSADSFVDYNAWQFADQLGLASYSTTATLNRQLMHASDENRIVIKSSIDALVANGSTATGDGINVANNELTSSRSNPYAKKFEVLLSDGGTNYGMSSTTAAQQAAADNIVIYTIGFSSSVDEGEMQNIANITDGNYYFAADANTLQHIYRLIALQIQESANDANVSVPVISGATVVDMGGATIVDGNMLFNAGSILPGRPWTGSYVLNFPCDHIANCGVDALSFPGPGAFFTYTDSNGVHVIDFNASRTVSFLNRDLTVNAYGARLLGENLVELDVNVANIGDLNSGETDLNFHLGAIDGLPLGKQTVGFLCGKNDEGCTQTVQLFSPVSISQQGVIYITVNDGNAVSECPGNNTDAVNCYSVPATQIIELEYRVWEK
ncbi:MAG: VWA domain-containing protein [Candidatus Diapherotrites archaeon]